MPEALQMLHQSPTNYQMPSKFQSLLNLDSQFNWSIDSVHCEFPLSGFYDTEASPMMMIGGTDDHFPSPEFAGVPFSNFSTSPVDELSAVSEVTAVIEQNQSSTKRKIEFHVVGEDCRKRRTKEDTVSVKSEVKAESCIDICNEKPKPVKDPKPDYIHVRARRGQATDSHSLAERARREKIKKKMQFLQDLVPGCNKVTNKAAMLDEIINYVQYLQKQVEFLSMKLAATTPVLDFKMENLLPKELLQLPLWE